MWSVQRCLGSPRGDFPAIDRGTFSRCGQPQHRADRAGLDRGRVQRGAARHECPLVADAVLVEDPGYALLHVQCPLGDVVDEPRVQGAIPPSTLRRARLRFLRVDAHPARQDALLHHAGRTTADAAGRHLGPVARPRQRRRQHRVRGGDRARQSQSRLHPRPAARSCCRSTMPARGWTGALRPKT